SNMSYPSARAEPTPWITPSSRAGTATSAAPAGQNSSPSPSASPAPYEQPPRAPLPGSPFPFPPPHPAVPQTQQTKSVTSPHPAGESSTAHHHNPPPTSQPKPSNAPTGADTAGPSTIPPFTLNKGRNTNPNIRHPRHDMHHRQTAHESHLPPGNYLCVHLH